MKMKRKIHFSKPITMAKALVNTFMAKTDAPAATKRKKAEMTMGAELYGFTFITPLALESYGQERN